MAVADVITEQRVEKAARVDVWIYLLGVPAFIPLIVSLLRPGATGFIQYDMAYYMANARQHFADGFHLTYSNPYAAFGSPAIYFQPHIFVLAILERIGIDPGVAFNLFGVASVAFATCAAIRLYREVIGIESRAKRIGLVIFFWGGGVLALAGLIVGMPMGLPFAKAVTLFDPNEGWWMLNFGRNLVYPTEAFYHGLFLTAMWMVVRRRIAAALVCSALLSTSHPYAGLSLALVLAGFGAIERNWKLLGGAVAIAAAHVGYYMLFLNRFADHLAVRAQWELDWPYIAWTFGPALYLVGFLALMRWRDAWKQRLFLVWFVVVFALTQHDAFVKPMQPIHFAHGYDWIALFFLGSAAMVGLIEKALARPMWVVVMLAVFCFDNIAWFATFRDTKVQRYAIELTPGERDALRWIASHAEARTTVVSEDRWINYLTPTYSNARAWFGHDYNTPHAEDRKKEVEAVFRGGPAIPAERVYYVPRVRSDWRAPDGSREVYANAEFRIWLKQRAP